jgi:hypothetical protein
MQGMWKKTRVPHRNRRTETMQTQKANFPFAILVAAAKPPHPHKERNRRKSFHSVANWIFEEKKTESALK